MEIKEIRDKLFNKLIDTGWDEKLRFFIKSSEFDDILLKLFIEVDTGFRFTPILNNVFKAFELCHFDKVKVVFVYPEPWNDPIVNQGLAISNIGVSHAIPKKAYKFIQELKRQVPDSSIINSDLTPWTSQGVLLLNRSLTTRISTPNKHIDIWQPFFDYVIEVLIDRKPIFVFIGNDWENLESFNCPEIPESYDVNWECDNIFLKINEKLKEKNLSQIIW